MKNRGSTTTPGKTLTPTVSSVLGKKKAKFNRPIKKKTTWGQTAIRPRASGVGLRLRTTQQRLGLGSSPEKALVILDDPVSTQPLMLTSLVAKPPTKKMQVEPRRSLRVLAQGDTDSTLARAVKRKEVAPTST